MKKVISIITALLSIVHFAVSIAAADYAKPPSYVPGSGGGSSVSQELSVSSVAESVVTGKAVDITRGETTLPLTALKDIIEQNRSNPDAKLSFESGKKGNEYMIEIPLSSIKNPRALNVDLKLDKVAEKTLLVSGEKVRIPEGSLYIEPSMKGDFGMDLNITFPKSHFATGFEGYDGAALVYVNLQTGEATIINDFIPFNDDGSISIMLQKASAYYLIPTRNPLNAESETATPKDNEKSDDSTPAADSADKSDIDDEDDKGNVSNKGNKNSNNNKTDKNYKDDDYIQNGQDNKPSSSIGDSTSNNNSDNTGSNTSSDFQSSSNNNSDNSTEKDPWWNSDSGELNPPTGTVLGGTTIATAAAVATIFSKKRKYHRRRRNR